MKKFFSACGNSLKEFGIAVAKGDIWTKLSLVVMGAGYIGRKQYARAIIMTLLEIGVLSAIFGVFAPYMAKLNTLGTVQREEAFDPLTMTKTVNDYDNSLLILLYGIIGILAVLVFILLYISNMKSVYRGQVDQENGRHLSSFKEDLKSLVNDRFHVTLLTFPSLGVIIMNIIPIIFMICIAFTNYDENHQPPTYLFTWVGLQNFRTMFTNSQTITFGYAFARILVWTIIWALLATVTTFFGGILLAQFINNKRTMAKSLWRTLFVITIGIPQFVTLLLISKMLGDNGIVNTFCANVGILDLFKHIGLLSESAQFIPFLSKPGWAHVTIILVNIWVGVPYQMLAATGILMNIPTDQIESARIDGANKSQIFWHITMPYVMFICGPSLIQTVISNINNFNVIYLLTYNYSTADMAMAASNAKEVDLLITWLFTLTNDYSNYKMASVIGIITFVISAALSLITFSRMVSGDKEGVYR